MRLMARPAEEDAETVLLNIDLNGSVDLHLYWTINLDWRQSCWLVNCWQSKSTSILINPAAQQVGIYTVCRGDRKNGCSKLEKCNRILLYFR